MSGSVECLEDREIYSDSASDDETWDVSCAKMCSAEERMFLEQVSQRSEQDLVAAFRDLPQQADSPHLDLMELCCEENSLLVKMWEMSGGKGGRLGLHNGCDLCTEQGTQEALRLVHLHRPHFLWISFPCGSTSPIQHLNELTEEGWRKSQKRRQRSRRLVRNGIRVIELHLCHGGELIQEWPMWNEAWHFSAIVELWDALRALGRCEDVLLDGCMFNLRTEQGEFMKKPWRLRTTVPGLLNAMALRCDGRHPHVPMLGGKRARRSALYTPELCRAVCLCLRTFFDESKVFGAQAVTIDRDDLKTLTSQELSDRARRF